MAALDSENDASRSEHLPERFEVSGDHARHFSGLENTPAGRAKPQTVLVFGVLEESL